VQQHTAGEMETFVMCM